MNAVSTPKRVATSTLSALMARMPPTMMTAAVAMATDSLDDRHDGRS